MAGAGAGTEATTGTGRGELKAVERAAARWRTTLCRTATLLWLPAGCRIRPSSIGVAMAVSRVLLTSVRSRFRSERAAACSLTGEAQPAATTRPSESGKRKELRMTTSEYTCGSTRNDVETGFTNTTRFSLEHKIGAGPSRRSGSAAPHHVSAL